MALYEEKIDPLSSVKQCARLANVQVAMTETGAADFGNLSAWKWFPWISNQRVR